MPDPKRPLDKEALGKKYLANGAQSCPVCENSNISGGHIDISGTEAWQQVDCGECGATWTDCYTLTAVENIETAEDQEAA